MSKGTTKQDYARALQVQDACNLSGVVFDFAKIMERICEDCRDSGTDAKNAHPIAVLFASKIASLTRCEDVQTLSDAWAACEERS